MAEQATGTATKAVEGSFEDLRDDIQAAVQASGLFGEHSWITNTFADSAIVCSYGEGKPPSHWRVAYSLDAAGAVVLGATERVEIAEVIVTGPAADAAMAEDAGGGEYNDDDFAGKSDADGLQYKAVDLKVKAVSDAEVNGVKGWTVEGYVTQWNVVDREGDVTIPGCFKRWLAEFGLPVAKYEHGQTVGKYLDAAEDDYGLLVKGFVPEDPATDLLHKLLKIGAVAKMSIGWRPYPGGMTKRADGVRELREIMLPEASFVAVPMHPGASITSVKGGGGFMPTASFDERVGAVTDALQATRAEAGALFATRAAAGRDLGGKNLEAMAVLAVASGDALLDLLGIESKAGRSLAAVRRRHLADMARSITALLAALPDGERAEVEALIEGGDTPADDAPKSGDVIVARRREAELYELKLQRYADKATNPIGVSP